MESKSTQKLSRATAATILATSTVAVGLPMQTGAATVFKDVKQGEYYTDAVYELVNKGVINGYTDGTFKPNRNITRGEAAKMLATALKLNLSNVQNNSFKDILPTHMYYKHISALANAGIINGMPDGNFKPNEIVQRSAMAKMVSLGYKFSLANQITHSFKDVSTDHFANYYIQTLLNLDITKGTSAVAFSPNSPVTRGQLATFISRASKADAGKPTYVVSNVTKDKIYINSVGYTIGANVRSFIKEANRSALLGAHIEGTFTGMTLTAVTKLTINNSGTASNLYVLDGASSTYNGQLVLNGSYIRLKNWTLNGQTLVAETPRKSLASYNILSNLRIASLSGTGIIDWGTPTNPENNSNLNDPDSGNLNSGSGNNRPYSAKMSSVQKYIDFTNTIVKNLTIEQNRTYIKATTDLQKVTIGRDVENVEIYADMKTLYLEGDTSVKIFGVHDIETAYKNSYYSVHFNTNAHIGTLIVDNSYGWIDLGEHVYIDKVIIPTGKTPNDIFDDYKNDNNNIGIIEDNKGDDVDRDPIENEIIPDVTKPIINELRVAPDSNQAEVTLTVNETGKYHYLVLPKGATVPTVRDIVSTQSGNSGNGTIGEGHVNSDGKYTTTFLVSGLESVKEYVIYVVHVDDAGNFSARVERDFVTKDGTPPQFMTATATGLAGGRRIEFDFKPSEKGTYYYFVREQQNIDTTVKVEDIIKGAQATGVVTADHVLNGFSEIIRQDENGTIIKPLTKYVVYAVLVDDSGNEIVQPAMLPVTTLVLDEIAPYVTGANNVTDQKLVPAVTGELNQFYMYFSEKLDRATAENINNYVLSGTGIVNVPGQETIKPSKVVYSEVGTTGSRVLITIPSLTGFVNGDTLRVTALPAIQDLAENGFEDASNAPGGGTPRNFAEYRHIDITQPNILDLSIVGNGSNSLSEVSFNATKAGTVYYMVLPSETDLNALGIEPKDFIAEFNTTTATNKFNVPGSTTDKIYLEGTQKKLQSGRTAELGNQKFDYDLSTLNPDPFITYDLFIVLKDRSGNLSPIEQQTLVADKKAPLISAYDIKAKRVLPTGADNTQAELSVTSDEKGTILYKVVEKYVVDTVASTPTQTKYKLNPLIYSAAGTYLPIPGTDVASGLSNIEREIKFREYFGTLDRAEAMNKGTTEVNITGLAPHKEYVIVMAVKDTFGNFTVVDMNKALGTNHVSQPAGDRMIKEFYTDYTVPKLINNLIFREFDNTFTITFSEAIMRKYEDAATLKEISSITDATSLASLVMIKDESGVDITSQYGIVGYTYASATGIEQTSKLVIKPNSTGTVNKAFTVTMKDAAVDQNINDNQKNKFDINDFGKYIYRNITAEYLFIRQRAGTADKVVDAVFDLTNTNLAFEANEEINYYYLSKPVTSHSADIALYTAEKVIEEVGTGISTGSLATGKSKVKVIAARAAIEMTHPILFTTGDYVLVALEDKYGNRILKVEKVGYEYVAPTNP